MPIAALPEEAARIITSSLSLTEATSVVKELIDNALDARADSISIEISSNTLDVIQVKDNGSGIGVEDRQLLCKRGCTSKIRTLQDLAALGGTFLGFRGEALASVAELSSTVTITTRIEGEIVGSALKFGANGKLSGSSSASHPIGTTVRVQDFLSTIPVRKQAAQKSATKTITNIRKLLQSYAFARSEVRFSFKVLKAKNEKSNWSFTPNKASAALAEVAAKLVGKDVTDQCKQRSVQSEADSGDGSCWRIQALVISPTSNVVKACASDQYFSVDRRPVSVERGLMKTLSKTYKLYLESSLAPAGESGTISKPFLVLQIDCPPDTYDVNVEPAKDLVVFHDQAMVEGLFSQLLQDIYGQLQDKSETLKPANEPKTTALSSFDLLLARKPQDTQSVPRQDPQIQGDRPSTSNVSRKAVASMTSRPRPMDTRMVQEDGETHNAKEKNIMSLQVVTASTAQTNMYPFDEEDVDDDETESVDASSTHESEMIDNVAVRNPWSVAKLNVRVPPKRLGVEEESQSAGGTTQSLETGESTMTSPGSGPASEKTPSYGQLSFQNPGPPMRRFARRADGSDEESTTTSTSDNSDTERGRTIIDNWVTRSARPTQQQLSLSSALQQDESFIPHSRPGHRQEHSISPLSGAGGMPSGSRPSQAHRPFKTPFKRGHQQQNPSPPSERAQYLKNLSSPVRAPNPIDHVPVGSEQLYKTPPSSSRSELDEILEFERQKKVAIIQQRKRLAAQGSYKRLFDSPLQVSQTSVDVTGAAMYAAAFSRDPPNLVPPSTGNVCATLVDFGARFSGPSDVGSEGRVGGAASQRSTTYANPLLNRYLAATRNLSQAQNTTHGENHTHGHDHSHGHPPSLQPSATLKQRSRSTDVENGSRSANMKADANLDDNTDAPPKMSHNDPRLYFIKSRQRSITDAADGHENGAVGGQNLSKTGLKIRRGKTSRLPLEVISADVRTSTLVFVLEVSDADFRQMVGRVKLVDEYVHCGKVDTVEYDPLPEEVKEWEARVEELLGNRYRSRIEGREEQNKGSAAYVDAGQEGGSLRAASADIGVGGGGEGGAGRGGGLTFPLNLAKTMKSFLDDAAGK